MKLILKAILKLENINTILDAPCGVGRASIMLSNKSYTTIGIDAGSGAITKAKEIAEFNKVNCIFKEADLRKIPYKKIHLMWCCVSVFFIICKNLRRDNKLLVNYARLLKSMR